MDSAILVFVTVIFTVSLAFNWTTLVLCSKKINAMSRKIKKLEKLLEMER